MKTATVQLEYQNYIDFAPQTPQQLHNQACENDGPTVAAWRPISEETQ